MLSHEVLFNADKECYIAIISETTYGQKYTIASYEHADRFVAEQWIDEWFMKKDRVCANCV